MDVARSTDKLVGLFSKLKINDIKTYRGDQLKGVIEQASVDPVIKSLCYSNELVTFWECVLRDQEDEYLDLYFDHGVLKPQPNLCNFDLVCGLYFYDKACHAYHHGNLSQAQHYMLRAESYGSIHAVFYLNEKSIEIIKQFIHQKKGQHFNLCPLINRLQRTAWLHGTPGYITLAWTCVDVATYHAKVRHNVQAATVSCQFALAYAYVAKSIEDDCEVSIHNAYFGGGIAASNSFGITTTDEVIASVKKLICQFVKLDKRDFQMLIQNNVKQETRRFQLFKKNSNIPSSIATYKV